MKVILAIIATVFLNSVAIAQTITIKVEQKEVPATKIVEVKRINNDNTFIVEKVPVVVSMPTKRYYIEETPVFVQQPPVVLAPIGYTYSSGLFGSTTIYANGAVVRRGMFGRVR